ncbi:MAG: FAD-dependent monooxygenase [Blastococcus sp.]
MVGAGPTGLTLALQAHDHGARVRVVERRPDAFRPSRALIVHPRTLEVLRPLGVTDGLMSRADTSPSVCLHLGSRVVPVRMAELALPDTAFPHLSLVRQADVEAVLGRALADRGVAVERGRALVGFDEDADGAYAVLRSSDGAEEAACGAIVGCDGVQSTVRTLSGIGWPGGTYRHEVVLADVDLDGVDLSGDAEPGEAHVVAGRRGLLFLFPLGEGAAWRLLATRPAGRVAVSPGDSGPPVPARELQHLLDGAGLDARVTGVAWSSGVRVQYRVAARFRRGRVFLAGDAAHASSPAGGQGMNTGIQDATNLGWKLAFAGTSSDLDGLLDSYHDERRPLAHQVLAMTHLIFWAESSTDLVASFLRGTLAPVAAPLVPLVLRQRRLVASGVRVLAQLDLSYRGSRLAVDGTAPPAGGPAAGDRLPDANVTCGGRVVRLHALLARPGVHVLVARDAREPRLGATGGLVHVHRLTSRTGCGVLAVRPDGYVGFRGGSVDDGELQRWLSRVGVNGEPGGA